MNFRKNRHGGVFEGYNVFNNFREERECGDGQVVFKIV